MSKNLRYSDILGDHFYKIMLTQDDKDMIDTHFTGAAHHLKRFHEAVTKEDKYFHVTRHRIHLRLMMTYIFQYGDFSEAIDPSNRDLEHKATWDPDLTVMPDPMMFRNMLPDWRFPVGAAHAADHYLHSDDFFELDKQSIMQN